MCAPSAQKGHSPLDWPGAGRRCSARHRHFPTGPLQRRLKIELLRTRATRAESGPLIRGLASKALSQPNAQQRKHP